MKFPLLPLAAVVVIASAGTAGAAEHHMMRQSSMTPAASDNLTLTPDQQKTAWRDLTKQAASQSAPSNFTATVGATVPNDIRLRAVPTMAASQLPELKPYRYAVLPNELLIVNPKDKKVVDVINRNA